MSRIHGVVLLISMTLMVGLVACQSKNNPTYTSPLKYAGPFAFTATPTPQMTNTPIAIDCQPTATPGAPPNGIFWETALVQGLTAHNGVATVGGIWTELLMTVNGAPEANDPVTVSGPGGWSAALTYLGPTAKNGNTFAHYYGLFPTGYQAGGLYSVTTTTSIGTASATLMGPGGISMTADDSNVDWTRSGMQNKVCLRNEPYTIIASGAGMTLVGSQATIFQNAACSSSTAPVNLPASDVSAPGLFTLMGDCRSMTSAITGGWGFFEVAQTTLGMAEVADPSIQIPVGTPIPGDSVVPSSDHLVPGSGTPFYLQCQIEPNPGFFIIEIYDTTGKKIKTLRSGYITSGSVINLAWDGLDNYASPVPDGIYFIFAKTPTLSKILPIQLVR